MKQTMKIMVEENLCLRKKYINQYVDLMTTFYSDMLAIPENKIPVFPKRK